MKKLLCAGAVALAASGLLSHAPAARAEQGTVAAAQGAAPDTPTAAINIARIKRVLNLKPAQMAYWPPVESALRRIVREQKTSSGGLIRRISDRVVSVVLTGAAIKRLATAARPLIARLDDDQKLAAVQLAQEMGLGSVVAALD